MLVIWSLFVPCILYLRLSKFQLSPAPGCRPPDRTGKKLVHYASGLKGAVAVKTALNNDATSSQLSLVPSRRSFIGEAPQGDHPAG